ncbi:MAG: DUF4197 domain-containing protein [Gammaproteobacteria bacterium]|jgi:hypothetical protein
MRYSTFLMSLGLLGLLSATQPGFTAGLASLSNADTVGGLKDALTQGASKAVSQLGAAGGFLDNAKVRIPLPDSLRKIERGLKFMGMGDEADQLVTSMNHAAEMAVKEASPILVDAVKKMSIKDAEGILTGGDTAATDYFRKTTSDTLTKKFLPIVQQATAKVQLAGQYNELAGQGEKLGLVKSDDANIDSYVTRKALDGLFLVIGEQEKAMRKDPLGAATGLARKVFSAL